MWTADDCKFMNQAIAQAQAATKLGDRPFGAVIVKNGKIVGKGKCENNTTGTVIDHAEILSLIDACKNLKSNNLNDTKIYCTNEPCPMCAAAIFQAKIPEVIIGLSRTDLPQLIRPRKISIADLASDSGYEIKIRRGLMKQEILDIFTQYFNNYTSK